MPATLGAAAENFRALGSPPAEVLGMLLLTQASGERVFEQLALRPAIGEWALSPADAEAETLIARNRQGERIAIVCGRQVRACHGLEVLALGTCLEFPDGLSLQETLDGVCEVGVLAVLPWGFGKWLGGRGRLIHETLQTYGARRVSVGDNGSRLAGWASPPLIEAARRDGFRVLPGTDPFPFARDYARVGRFGFFAATHIDARAPWGSLRAWLESLQASPQYFGRPTGVARFVFNQIGIQLYNRFLRKAAA